MSMGGKHLPIPLAISQKPPTRPPYIAILLTTTSMAIHASPQRHLRPGSGNDYLNAGNGTHIVGAGDSIDPGFNTLTGDTGNDTLYGGTGNDKFYAGSGTNTCYGNGHNLLTGYDLVYGCLDAGSGTPTPADTAPGVPVTAHIKTLPGPVDTDLPQ
jgi:hypothetical protein